MFTVIGFDFQGWIYSKNWGKGNAETLGRRFYYIFLLPFTAQFLMRIIYDMQIYCSCEDNAVYLVDISEDEQNTPEISEAKGTNIIKICFFF